MRLQKSAILRHARLCCVALACLLPQSAVAKQTTLPPAAVTAPGTDSVVGLWRAIDDKSKKPSSLIRLRYEGETLVGQIEKILNPKAGANPICKNCRGDRANKPLRGMVIIWGLHPDERGFSGGEVLDPGSGSTYRCKIKLLSRDTLEVRGYLGFSALGRSQIWQREAETSLGEAK